MRRPRNRPETRETMNGEDIFAITQKRLRVGNGELGELQGRGVGCIGCGTAVPKKRGRLFDGHRQFDAIQPCHHALVAAHTHSEKRQGGDLRGRRGEMAANVTGLDNALHPAFGRRGLKVESNVGIVGRFVVESHALNPVPPCRIVVRVATVPCAADVRHRKMHSHWMPGRDECVGDDLLSGRDIEQARVAPVSSVIDARSGPGE